VSSGGGLYLLAAAGATPGSLLLAGNSSFSLNSQVPTPVPTSNVIMTALNANYAPAVGVYRTVRPNVQASAFESSAISTPSMVSSYLVDYCIFFARSSLLN
jgi:hypothetical protein